MTRDRRFRNVLLNNWELGSVLITDPGDQPLSPDQSAFPVCWPRGPGGGPGPRMNLSPMCSTCHPVGKNGNDSSRVRHWSVIWVKPPHEKHPSTESDDGSGEATSSSVTVPTGSQFSNNVSKSVVRDRSCATGVGGRIASISCWIRRSRSERIGTACRGGGAGVGNSFYNPSLIEGETSFHLSV